MKTLNLIAIKQRRIELNITLQDMAVKFGFKNGSTYMKYENGVYSFKADHLPLLANILKCSIEDFFKPNIAVLATNSTKEVS